MAKSHAHICYYRQRFDILLLFFSHSWLLNRFLIFTCTITIFALTSATTCTAVSIITINAFSTHSSDTCSCASCTFTP